MVDKRQAASERGRSGGVLAHRVMVVDDHEIVRGGLVALIREHEGLEVGSAVASADEALTQLTDGDARTDLVVADLILGKGLDGIQLTKGIKVRHPLLPVLVLSGRDEALFAERALDAGASGYVMKDEAVELLFEAMEAALAGHLWVSNVMRERLLPRVLSDRASDRYVGRDGGVAAAEIPPVDDLDTRALLRELERGNRTVFGIARALARSHVEVEVLLEGVRRRLELPSRASLFLFVDRLAG